MSVTLSPLITAILNRGLQEAKNGRAAAAIETFREVLDYNPSNETAVLWLAYLCEDVYETVTMLKSWVEQYPSNQYATAYLYQATERCNEVEQLLVRSTTYNYISREKEWGATSGTKVLRLGEYLVTHGVLTPGQLNEVLGRYQELLGQGQSRRIGQVIVELGYLDFQQLKFWLNQQSSEYVSRFRD